MKLLSIAIPTYNRSKYLREELNCILPQLLPFKEEVEIQISDNCSTDDTGIMVEEISAKYNFPIGYKRLEKGIYFEDNFDTVVGRCSGKYIQMSGDDDIFDANFYPRLINLLKEHQYGLLHFNRLECDAVCSNGRLYDKNYEKNEMVMEAGDFIRKCMAGPGFMTSFVFSKECWDKGEMDLSSFYGYRFLSRLYHGAIQLGVKCYYCYIPLILMRNPSRAWGGQYCLFHFVGLSNLFKCLDSSIPGLFQKWEEKLHHSTALRGNLVMLGVVANNKSFFCEKKEEFFQYFNKREKIAFDLLLKLPAKVFLPFYYRFVKWFL